MSLVNKLLKVGFQINCFSNSLAVMHLRKGCIRSPYFLYLISFGGTYKQPLRRRQWHSTSVLLLENPMDRGAWQAAVHGVAKSQTRLNELTFTFHLHALEKEMAIHSSVLAWRIPRDRGAWWAAVCGVTQSRTRLKRLSSISSISSHVLYVQVSSNSPYRKFICF